MSQMKTPLVAESHRLIDARGDQLIAEHDLPLRDARHLSEDDAARIAACANACQGLERPEEAVETLKMLVRDLYACGAEGGRIDSLWHLVEDAAALVDWPTDACWGCGDAGEDGVWWSETTGCCDNCGRTAKPPAPVG